MIDEDVKKVVTIAKLLRAARNIDKKYNELPAIIANRDMFIGYDVDNGITFVRISYGEYKYQIALSYQEMYYEGFDSLGVYSLMRRAINALIHQAQNPRKKAVGPPLERHQVGMKPQNTAENQKPTQ